MYPMTDLPLRTHCGYIRAMGDPNKIRERRKACGLSEDGLAEAVGTGRSTIVKLQKGKLPLSVQWAEKLAVPLACHPWELLPDEKNEEFEAVELLLRWRAMGRDGKVSVLNVSRQIPPITVDQSDQ